MIINNNIPALNTYRQLGINQGNGQKAMEKLSSGLRINRAGDDAAGLAISEKMRAQIRGLSQASRNSQDAISLIQTAEGALNETQNILQRMRELATQAANDTNVDIDRSEIQKEINQLSSEINRIGNTTEFNTMTLLNGTRSDSVVTGSTTSEVTIISDAVLQPVFNPNVTPGAGLDNAPTFMNGTTANQIGIDTSYNGFNWGTIGTAVSTITISKENDGELRIQIDGQNTAGATLSVDDVITADADGNFTYSAHGISFTISAEDYEAMGDPDATNSIAIEFTGTDAAAGFVGTSNDFDTNDVTAGGTAGAFGSAGITITGANLLEGSASIQIEWSGDNTGAGTFTVTIRDADGNELSTDEYVVTAGGTLDYDNHGVSFILNSNQSTEIDFTYDFIVTETTQTIVETEDRSLQFQIGANQNQALSISLSDMRSEALGITSTTGDAKQWVEISRAHESLIEAGVMITGTAAATLGLDASKFYIEATFTTGNEVTNGTNSEGTERALSMASHESARAAVTVINDAIERVSGERSKLGATQNRLEHTIANLDNAAENLQAAESRIRDVDMAREIMEFTKNNILSQASQAMLAQANQAPQSVLQLLR